MKSYFLFFKYVHDLREVSEVQTSLRDESQVEPNTVARHFHYQPTQNSVGNLKQLKVKT